MGGSTYLGPAVSGTNDQRDWISDLRGPSGQREPALADLHSLLLRGAHFELARRGLSGREADDLADQAADDALLAILAKLDTFEGRSRFTTWAYKFVLLEAGVKARRRAWHGREVVLADDVHATAGDPHDRLETSETLRLVRDAVRTRLTDHQRVVFVALALDGVPIDVLAERLSTTRGALYKTLHDARHKLRAALSEGSPT
jgi:RNA polymerase sigma-70 factor (ECF subfamily)